MQIKNHIKYVVALLLIVLPTTALAASVTLRWQANQEPDISSYNVYYGTESRQYGQPIPAGNATSYSVVDLIEGSTYYFALTAVDTSGNESGYSGEVTANATSSEPTTEDYQLLFSTNSNRSNAVKLDDQTISGDVYIFLNPEAYVSQVVFSIDGQTHNTENYAPYDLGLPFDTTILSNGAHTITAAIRLQNGSITEINSNCVVYNESSTPTVPTSPPNSVSLSTSPSSPQPTGLNVTVSAVASGGSGDYEYRYWLSGPSTGNTWQMISDYSTNASYVWTTPSQAGTYTIGVWARNNGSTDGIYKADSMVFSVMPISTPITSPPSSVSLTEAPNSPQVPGTLVTFTASASGGSGDYEYRYWLRGPSTGNTWQMVRDYAANASFQWTTPSQAGTYTIGVWARNTGSTDGVYKTDSMAYIVSTAPTTITSAPTSVSLSTSPSSPQPMGADVAVTATTLGGSGDYEYRYWLLGPSTGNTWQMIRDYSANASYVWSTPALNGTYRIGVWSRNAGSTDNKYVAHSMIFSVSNENITW